MATPSNPPEPDPEDLPHWLDEYEPPAANNSGDLRAAPVWHQLDAEQAALEMEALTEWTHWLVDRYRIDDRIPQCWNQHDPLIEELSALRSAWIEAYILPSSPLSAATTWHHTLANTLDRTQTLWRTNCTTEHKPKRPGWASSDELLRRNH